MEKKQEVSPPEEKNADRSRGVDKKESKSDEFDLPLESSPYVNYDDLDDYKLKGYGAEGHLQPEPGRGAGATDAPTPSGAAGTRQYDVAGAGTATDTINHQGVP
ncbi:unnamed protein product [Linum tenue]|uniref:Late embryogenesis abundant protein, LEA-18 n=1 Tax=Linum tenue TaxID=586396 RepID=A0AAV0L9F4_9ROSI|nr:unnamed protein product [Linum tenue]